MQTENTNMTQPENIINTFEELDSIYKVIDKKNKICIFTNSDTLNKLEETKYYSLGNITTIPYIDVCNSRDLKGIIATGTIGKDISKPKDFKKALIAGADSTGLAVKIKLSLTPNFFILSTN